MNFPSINFLMIILFYLMLLISSQNEIFIFHNFSFMAGCNYKNIFILSNKFIVLQICCLKNSYLDHHHLSQYLCYIFYVKC